MFKDLYLFMKDIYQNRKLLLQFSINDFKSRYAGSFLGILWAFINPLFTVLIYWLVFGVGLKAQMIDAKYPFIVYLVTGMIPWFFFSDAFASTTVVFREYTYLVKKVVFNIRILPTTKIPIQFVHPFIFHSDWHSCCAYKWYISFSHVFTADLLSILHVCFLDRIDLADSIHPTIFTRHHAIDYDRLAVDHVDVADIMEPEPV